MVKERNIIVIILILLSILYAASLNSYLSLYGDNAVFIILAKSILTQGKYSHIGMVSEPSHTQFPFIFPLMLVPIIAIFGINILAMKILITILALASVFLIWFFFKIIDNNTDQKPNWFPIIIAILSGLSPFMGEFTHKVMSEYPYVFFSFLAIIFLAKYHRQERWLTKTGIATTFLITISYFTRSIGIVIFIGSLLYIFLEGISKQNISLRFKKALLIALVFIIATSAWEFRNRSVSSKEKPDYINQFFMKDPYNKDLGTIGFGDLTKRTLDNYNRYKNLFANVTVNYKFVLTFLTHFLPYSILCLLLLGYFYCLIKHRTIVEYVFTLYVFVVLLWPWSGARFIMPIIPFLLYYFLKSLGILKSLVLKSGWGKFVAVPILNLILLILIYCLQTQIWIRSFSPAFYLIIMFCVYLFIILGKLILKIRITSAAYVFIVLLMIGTAFRPTFRENVTVEHRRPYYQGQWNEYYEMSHWIKANTPEDSIIMSRKPELFYIWTGRKQAIYPFTRDKEAVIGSIYRNNVNYIALDSFTWTKTTLEYLVPALEGEIDKLNLVKEIGKSKIYEVKYPE